MKTAIYTTASCMALAVLLAGCLVGPDFERPETDLPATYLPGTLADAATNLVDAAAQWRSFDDPVLATLVEAGLEGNLGVRQALARVRAIALYKALGGAVAPE